MEMKKFNHGAAVIDKALKILQGCAVAAVICYLGVSPIWFILVGAIIGVVLSFYEKPKVEKKGGAE